MTGGDTARSGRHAVYLVPPEGSALEALGGAWLGRDAATGAALARPVLAGIDPALAEAVTEGPRFYGFHGTLKAPFALAAGRSAGDLLTAARRLAATRAAFALPALTVAALGRFVALVPAAPSPDLHALAAACVRELDAFRAPASAEETAARRAAGLSARQLAHLERWGYPHVFEDFHFHMTLTGPVVDDALRDRLVAALANRFASAVTRPGVVQALGLFHQPDRRTPFRQIARVPLLAPAGTV